MTRADIIPLIKMLFAIYPNHKVNDVKSLVDGWEMIFGEDDAKLVYRAVRFHMSTNKWFPEPSEIKERLPLAALMYEDVSQPRLATAEVDGPDWNTGCDICHYRGDMCLGDNCFI